MDQRQLLVNWNADSDSLYLQFSQSMEYVMD